MLRDGRGVVLRAASDGDSGAVAEIWFDGWRDGHLGNVPDDLVAVRTRESFGVRAAERVGDTTVAVVDGVVAGFAMVVGDEVEQVYVAGRHRGSGVAGALLAEAERLVGANGYGLAWLAVAPGNGRARRFYERNGWVDEGLFEYSAMSADGPIPVPCHRYVKRVAKEGRMREADVFELADYALRDVVERIKDDQWEREVPDGMRWRAGTRLLRDVVNHHAYDDIWVPEVLAGKTVAEVGDKYDGDLLGADPRRSFSRIVDTAVAAVRELEDFDRIVHLSYGDFPARVYLMHIIIFRGFGAYDIAKFAGMDTELPAPLVQGLWELIEPEAEGLREMGVFGPRITVPDDAPLQDRLLALAGRDPSS